jgi:hypothetical protein
MDRLRWWQWIVLVIAMAVLIYGFWWVLVSAIDALQTPNGVGHEHY